MQTLKHMSMAYKNAFKYQWHTKMSIKNQIIYEKNKNFNNPGQGTMLNSAYLSIPNT